MYLQVAIKFRIASTSANPPIFRKVPTGSMDKAKESFGTEIGSEASIKGVNNNCIFSGEEDLGTNDICFGEVDSDTNDICFGEVDSDTNDICFGEVDSDTNDICFGEEEVDWP